MRPGAGLNATAVAAAAVAAPVVTGGGGHSAWHSPVPYLFGGLAAMLGLISFALFILACSYWKLSGYLEGGSSDGDGGVELYVKPVEAAAAAAACYEEKVVVIMAGDEKPTYLATPVSSRPACSFVDQSCRNGDDDEEEKKKVEECRVNGNVTQGKEQSRAQNLPV
ncbi:protein GLUTAMINE DUMPER 2 [Canna indica]|uniref:Protein GLUTAMINE DUMPER 2 n=1 Tax=Canna indica TaxID=4628 RepID=A0AAQ3L6Q0_9LILI|nr:protein GLUTAMINE DUMPER 2 [Canna indica]